MNFITDLQYQLYELYGQIELKKRKIQDLNNKLVGRENQLGQLSQSKMIV